MPSDDEFFTPDDVDEQIDSLAHAYGHVPETVQPAERIVAHLRHYYIQNDEKQHDPLDSAWKRIVEQHQATQQTPQRKGRLITMHNYQNEQEGTTTPRKRRTLIQRLGVLAAVLFVGLLIGGMALALNVGHQGTTPRQKQTLTGSGGTPVPPPPHPITGGKCTIDTTHPHAQVSTANQPGLYIFSMNDQSDNLLYHYDAQTKKVVWSIKLCNAFEANGTLAQNGILYLAGTDWTQDSTSGSVSYLYALNETDGSAIWGIQFPTQVIPFQPDSPNYGSSPLDLGVIETPTIANGILYVVQRNGAVYAYNATTGSHLWTFNSGRNAWATTKDGNGSILEPSSVQVVNGVAYFSIVDRLYALDAKRGSQLWMHSFNNALNINQSPAIDNGRVYLTAFVPGYGSVLHPNTYVYAFDAQTGAQKWVTKKLAGYLNAPIAYNGNLAVASYDGVLFILNPASGAIESHTTLSSENYASPTPINGVLYNLTENGANNALAVLNADGSTKWSAQIAGQYPVLQDVQDGVIYISARGSGVYGYSATNGHLLWHYAGYLPQPQSNLWVTVVL